jgi:hypothetical protein
VKYKSQVYTQASGSIGGITYSHNSGGLYTRARAIPTDPASAYQQTIRAIVGGLATAYNTELSTSQRAAWKTYAAQVPIVDALGEPINIGAIAMYIRSNVQRLRDSLARIDDAPTDYNLGETPDLTMSASEATQVLSGAWSGTPDWSAEDGAYLFLFASRPQNPSINYFKGPYLYAGRIAGNSGAPPASPGTWNAPFPFVEGQKIFVKANVARADGRYSTPFRGGCTAAA